MRNGSFVAASLIAFFAWSAGARAGWGIPQPAERPEAALERHAKRVFATVDSKRLEPALAAKLLGSLRAELRSAALPLDRRTEYRCLERGLVRVIENARVPEHDNRARFEHVLRWTFGLDWGTGGLLERAIFELQRVRTEMDRAAAAMGPGLDLRGALELLKQGAPANGEVLLRNYRLQTREARAFVMTKELATLPRGAWDLWVEPHNPGPAYPFCYYLPAWGERRATVKVCAPDKVEDPVLRAQHFRAQYPEWTRIVALHEGVPGHHLQHTVWNAKASRAARHIYNPAVVEGWGLYSESLMEAAGYCDEPGERLAWLQMRAWRAARIIINFGIHVRDMGDDEAVRLLVQEVGLEEASARVEVGNHRQRPFYYAGYLAGCLTLEALREEVRASLGARYSDRWYHDTILGMGPAPLDLVREGVIEAAEELRRLEAGD